MADISDLPAPPSGGADIADLPVPEDTGSKYSVKDILKRATALPEAVIKGIGKRTGQEMTMEPTEKVKKPIGERGLEAAGAGGFGAAAALAAPKVLQAFPMTRPVGMAMELIPPAQRAMGGFAGGVASDVTRQGAQAMGAPTAVQLPLEMLSATLGDYVGSKLTQSLGSMIKTGYYAAKGNIPMATSYGAGILGESPGQRQFQAATRQKQIFGAPKEGFVPGAETTQFRDKTQQELGQMVKDKYSIDLKPGEKASEQLRNRMYSDVGSVVAEDAKRQEEVQSQVAELKKKLAVTKLTEQAPIKAQIAELEAQTPSSLFSKSESFSNFEQKMNVLKERGSISKSDYEDLMRRLKTDTSKNPEVRGSYGKTVDEIIREWQGALTAEGKPALSASVQKEVRTKLRDSFGEWQNKTGIGSSEKDYRAAYTAEKTAEAKDKVPYIISKFGTQGEADQLALQTLRDPEMRTVLRTSIREHLQNTPPEKLASEYNRMEKLLVKSDLISASDATKRYRKLVDQIEQLRKQGKSAIPLQDRFYRQLVRTMADVSAAETSGQTMDMKK